MRILLLGEYSNVHWTLAEGLRALGHEVCVVSNGDFWKSYQKDISLVRKSTNKWDSAVFMLKLLTVLPRLRNYDVVQIINPCFLEIKVEKNLTIYHYLKKYNKKVFLAGYGNDFYWVNACANTDVFRYSDFKIWGVKRENSYTLGEIKDWIGSPKEFVNREIAETCNGIVTGLYEYYVSYQPYFKEKTTFIPFPINREKIEPILERKNNNGSVNFFIGIQKTRNEVKGTDIMYKALKEVKSNYPKLCNIVKVESVPFSEYQQKMNQSDILLDQLYSYTPAMNGLLAMAKGLVLVGGGEEENYEILGEKTLRPIINVLPNEKDVFDKLEMLILEKNKIPELSRQSIEYIKKYHDHLKVAQQYLDFWDAH
ncbi:MAG: glycosyltransferase family 1 protein [Bacteroides sp.]